MILAAIEFQWTDLIPIAVQLLVTTGAIFGGAGFWQWKQTREQAKRDAESKEKGVEKKVDDLAENFKSLNTKVDGISIGMQEIKDDVMLLQIASEETRQYRESKDKRDVESSEAQQAVIESLRAMIRDRLLDAYDKCMAKGYYTKEERETYGELFKCYENKPFDGNGIMHQLQPKIQALPWTAEEAGVGEYTDDD